MAGHVGQRHLSKCALSDLADDLDIRQRHLDNLLQQFGGGGGRGITARSPRPGRLPRHTPASVQLQQRRDARRSRRSRCAAPPPCACRRFPGASADNVGGVAAERRAERQVPGSTHEGAVSRELLRQALAVALPTCVGLRVRREAGHRSAEDA